MYLDHLENLLNQVKWHISVTNLLEKFMKKLLFVAAILMLSGCRDEVKCVLNDNKEVECPANLQLKPEEQVTSTYITEIEGCKIYYIDLPMKWNNIYLSKCDNVDSSVQYDAPNGKSTVPVSNATQSHH